MQYDVLIVGGGPGGIYSAYELLEKRPDLKIALFEAGHALARRHCPIDGVKVKSCVKCPTCAIMNGFGGAGAFSDGKYNITNQFGGTLHEYIGKKQALELMEYVDEINVANGGEGTHLYSTGATPIKKLCLENDLHLLDASVRHLGTDKNLVVLEHLYNRLKDKMDIYFDTPVQSVERTDGGYRVVTDKGSYDGRYCVISVGRSGSKWMEQVCRELDIATKSNRVDIGVRVELPYEVFAHLTDDQNDSKINNRTIVEGQIYGGLAQGIGLALTEDYEDIKKHSTMAGAGIPTIKDIPDDLELIYVETPRPAGPFGASGTGELPLCGPHPAIINAIYNACGARVTHLPAYPEKVLAAMPKK